METLPPSVLSRKLVELESATPDFWTFDGRDERSGAHAIFQYPAMMVPEMQGTLLDVIKAASPGANRILDPFVGSGTSLVEAMYRGFDFVGVDINPLAGLVSTVKALPIDPRSMVEARERILARIKLDRGLSYFTSFENQQKWFARSASIALSRV